METDSATPFASACSLNRRNFLAVFSALGLSHTLMPGVLWGMAQEASAPAQKSAPPEANAQAASAAHDPVPQVKITRDMIDAAAAIAGVHIDDQYKDMMLEGLNDQLKDFKTIYDLKMPNSVPMSLIFNPVLPGNEQRYAQPRQPMRMSAKATFPAGAPNITRSSTPKDLEQVAFYSVRQLAELVRTKRVSATALTEMYLTRLKRYDPLLHFVITLTEERAMSQARAADRDIAAGRYRGPLHGLPWGAKDLLAAKGYPTTWGAGGFEHQVIDEDATVVKRLDAAGAVLVAKLTLGALAMDDGWFGGRTRNPWLPSQGSSGSSAGPASATAAGCVAFSIGSETLGSISSPSTRCGCTGLRPTYGRVPKTGAMALSWSMDKLGPICRAAEDCALVLDAIHGPDGEDPDVHDYAFNWNAELDVRTLRVGYLKSEFEKAFTPSPENEEEDNARAKLSWEVIRKANDNALGVLQHKLGITLKPVELPQWPWPAIADLLTAEGAAAFDATSCLPGRPKTIGRIYSACRGFIPRWSMCRPPAHAIPACRRRRNYSVSLMSS